MSRPTTYEQQVLQPAEALLRDVRAKPSDHDARLEVLEAAASRLGGFELAEYRQAFPLAYRLPSDVVTVFGGRLVEVLSQLPLHPALALSALARPPLEFIEQRTSGAYYTDFRLAGLLGDLGSAALTPSATIVDPACGTGILLVAAVIRACGSDRVRRVEFLRSNVVAADRSSTPLRGARLALASMCDDVSSIVSMHRRWRVWDSLLAPASAWRELAPDGFDVVIANPPWEKMKVSRHEFLRARGATRHYGHDYGKSDVDADAFAAAANSVEAYASELVTSYDFLGSGETDLYQPFLELFIRLVRKGGCVSALVPAGLIRSRGTRSLRERLFATSTHLEFTVLENRARFFSIDTRFKFLALRAVLGDSASKSGKIVIRHVRTRDECSLEPAGSASIGRATLVRLRPDLTIPEVRSAAEWRLFRRMCEMGTPLSESSDWRASIVREVDMSRQRPLFSRAGAPPAFIPLIEGRMVHQHRFGAKRYVSGTGRRARWDWVPLGIRVVEPQFWFPVAQLAAEIRRRVEMPRVGFCDITGQTNERSMLAALVPAGVLCGNKVPTMVFSDTNDEDRLFLWLAVANSLPFDWMLRRIVTTTVNYFLLRSLPFPKLVRNSLRARRLISAAQEIRQLSEQGQGGGDALRIGQLRADIDVQVAAAYGLGYSDLELILEDFPLLDRSQQPIRGESRSRVTADVLLYRASRMFKIAVTEPEARVDEARKAGAAPYVPSESISEDGEHPE